MKLIELQDLKKTYITGDTSYEALKGIDLIVRKGDFISIMGPSGSGKSTMLHILGCLDVPTEGKYLLDGIDIRKLDDDELSGIRNERIGFVFQAFNLLPKISVLDNVMLPFLYSHVSKKEWKHRAIDVLKKVGLEDKLKNKPNQLSGGQVQRVAIARSLVMDPSIILADEPTGNLDTKTGGQVMEIFETIHDEGKTIVIITHENHIAKYANETVYLKDGLIEDRFINKKEMDLEKIK
ncbi:ATP-binding cassette domain-containing protein [Candidatus Dojkabacteria bacterium]|nr:ATP-binding cassette domain-containing protein [Candidatus Dojkabacteria bacterium]